jgi:hypothetical protein
MSRVLSDAGEELARQERVPSNAGAASTANIDVTTKVVIPHVTAMAVA